ncbi:uncharacterized protein [Asterias amurensis]|uniref:uncharacterized protein n=1 Tax=Asterias amurensis TaxID=7602 RepID=UPI003AB82563
MTSRGGHLRSGSANLDNRAFREAVARMREEVLESKAETQRVKDQLNCLVMLVKRAWMGDQAAAVHVANIVGTAPPKFLQDEEKQVDGVNKTRALHHWAMLSIGLLNRHFRQLKSQALSRAKERLQQRQDFLDQQLARHRALLKQASGVGLASMKKTSNPYLEKPHSAWNSRPKSSKPSRLHQTEFDYPTDFRPSKPDPTMATNMVEHLANAATADREYAKAARDRFSQPDLFNASYVVADRGKPKRPISGHQKFTDNQRTRPKSAVIATTKGERPLKYETTRPVSGKPSSSATKPRAKSAKATSNRIFEMTEGQEGRSNNAQQLQAKFTALEEEFSLFDQEEAEREGPSVVERQNGGHTHYKDNVTDGLRKIATMEDDFRKTTKMLQQKLGITGEGVV